MPSTSVDCPRTSYPGKCIPSILLLDAGSSARMPLVGLSSIIRPPYQVSSRSAQGRHSICTRWIPLVARIIRSSLPLCLPRSFLPASVRFFVTPQREDFPRTASNFIEKKLNREDGRCSLRGTCDILPSFGKRIW